MKAVCWSALACVSVVLTGCPQNKQAERREVVASKVATVQIATSTSPSDSATSEVTLTLDTLPVTAEITKGDRYAVTLLGTWQNAGTGAVYLQASDSAGTFVAPAPMLVSNLSSYRIGRSSPTATYRIGLSLPTATAAGLHTGTLAVRACADSLCVQPYADTTHSIGYTLQVNALAEWETLQRTSRHDGYVPVQINAARYRKAWFYPAYASAVVTGGGNVYFSEPGFSSVYAKRATDGVTQWRRVFSGTFAPVNPPTVSNGVVYVATTANQDTWLYALRASDGMQSYQSRFYTQWAEILNPAVRNGKVYVNTTGVVYAFNLADGAAAWNASGGTNGMNTPAADDDFAYVHNGSTLNVFNAADGSLFTSIGPNPNGVYYDYYGTPMLGSTDHVLAYSGGSYNGSEQRQLLDYSVADQATRWISVGLYNNYPAVAKGVVYATSNETRTLDALDETTGRRLWSWRPGEQSFHFIGNVVVTDNVVFVSTNTRLYAIDLQRRRPVWSAPTPGTMSISADRMLFVSTPNNALPDIFAGIHAYRLD